MIPSKSLDEILTSVQWDAMGKHDPHSDALSDDFNIFPFLPTMTNVLFPNAVAL